MFDFGDLGKILVIFGLVVVGLGVWLIMFQRVPFIGRLPGDISVQGQGFSCFVPLATSIVLSILLTVILNIALRLLNR